MYFKIGKDFGLICAIFGRCIYEFYNYVLGLKGNCPCYFYLGLVTYLFNVPPRLGKILTT